LRLSIDISPKCPTLHTCDTRVGIDVHTTHAREINDQPAVAARVSCHGVATAAHGDEQPVLASELHRRDNIGRSRAPDD